MSNELKDLRVSNDAMDDPAELQRRIADEGYLFFKQLVSPDKLWELRREMMSVIQQVGWLVADTDPMDGIADINMRYTEGDNEYSAGYAEVYKIENFHRSAHWLEYLEIVAKMVGAHHAPSPEDRPHLVPQIHRTHYAEAPGFRAFSRQLRKYHLLGAHRRLPN